MDWHRGTVRREEAPELLLPISSTSIPACARVEEAEAVCHHLSIIGRCLHWALGRSQQHAPVGRAGQGRVTREDASLRPPPARDKEGPEGMTDTDRKRLAEELRRVNKQSENNRRSRG